jgi:hypothetical protein
MRLYCVACRRHLCRECAGGSGRDVCQLVRCDRCSAARAGEQDLLRTLEGSLNRLSLQHSLSEVLQYTRREATVAVHRRAHATLLIYGAIYGALTLPATPEQVAHWITWMIIKRTPTLDSSTAALYSGVISDWHTDTHF